MTRIILAYRHRQEWPNPIISKNGDGNKNSLWVMKGTIIFSHERLSRNSEKKFPHERRSREWGNFFLLWLLSLEWGNIIVPWMTNREFFPSPFFKMIGYTFLLSYWKLSNKVSWGKFPMIFIKLREMNSFLYCWQEKFTSYGELDPFLYS